MREAWDHLGQQWEHGVKRVAPEYEVQHRQRQLLHIAEDRGQFEGAPVQHLDPKKVLPTQQFIERKNHERISSAPASDLPPVDVVQKGRSYYVLDGHHRWDVARQQGRPLPARVVAYRPRT